MVRKKSSSRKNSNRSRAGRRGGEVTRDMYGEEFYSEIGRLGGRKRSAGKAKKQDDGQFGEIFFPNTELPKK